MNASKLVWVKSSFSGGANNCVEVARGDDFIAVRNSKKPEAGTAVFTHDEWQAFLSGAKDGEFDL